jgi:DNA-binding transcriptional LysR family regulator
VPLGRNEFGWFAGPSLAVPRRTLSPADLQAFQLIVPPPPARLHATVAKWFADAGVKPRRVSTCNSIHATAATVAQGAAIGILPVRIMQAAQEEGSVKRLKVSPPVPGHKVAICYQIHEFGPGLRILVDLILELAAKHELFAPHRASRA